MLAEMNSQPAGKVDHPRLAGSIGSRFSKGAETRYGGDVHDGPHFLLCDLPAEYLAGEEGTGKIQVQYLPVNISGDVKKGQLI